MNLAIYSWLALIVKPVAHGEIKLK